MLTTLDGTPYSFELVPANADERDAADEILDTLPPDSEVWSDKGCIGAAWQARGLNRLFVFGQPDARTSTTRTPPSLIAC